MTRTASLAAAAIALVALAGCATAVEPEPEAETSASPSATPAPSAESTPSASEEPGGIDTSDWLEYSTHDGEMTYRYPADWTLEQTSTFFSPDADRDDVTYPYERWMDDSWLTAPNGQQLLGGYDVVDLGGACGGPENFQPIEVLASEPLEGAAEATTIETIALRSVDGRWTFGLGLVSGGLPDVDTCVVHFMTGTSDGGVLFGTTPSITSAGDDPLWTVDTLDDATAYMETDEYATILEILRSVRTS